MVPCIRIAGVALFTEYSACCACPGTRTHCKHFRQLRIAAARWEKGSGPSFWIPQAKEGKHKFHAPDSSQHLGECSLAGHGVFESESAVLSKIPPILGGSGRLLVVSEWSLGGFRPVSVLRRALGPRRWPNAWQGVAGRCAVRYCCVRYGGTRPDVARARKKIHGGSEAIQGGRHPAFCFRVFLISRRRVYAGIATIVNSQNVSGYSDDEAMEAL